MYRLLEMSELGTSMHRFVTVKELIEYVSRRSIELDRSFIQFSFDVAKGPDSSLDDELDGIYYASLND